MLNVILFVAYVCLSAGGLILFKLGVGTNSIEITNTFFALKFSWIMFIGVLCYCFSFLIWLMIVSRLNLSIAMPLSVGFVNLFVLLGSSLILKENISVCQWIGVGVIVVGLAIVSIGKGIS